MTPRSKLPSFVFPAAAVGAVGVTGGGYFPDSWGWIALGPLLVVAAVLVRPGRIELGRLERLMVGTHTILLCWTAASGAWSESVPLTLDEVRRDLIYAGAVAAALVLGRPGTLRETASGILTGVTLIGVYALVTGRTGTIGYGAAAQLTGSVGYWNGLALIAAIGILLAIGLGAEGTTPFSQAPAAAALATLVPTLYLTLSRGGWAALGVGLAVAFMLTPTRRRLAAFGLASLPFCALGVWLVSDSSGFELGRDRPLRLLALLAVVLAASALVPLGMRQISRMRPARQGWRLSLPVLAAVVMLLAAGLVAMAVRAERPADRLFSLSGHGRADYWSVAWREYTSAPVLGTGAGTFELHWNRDRPSLVGARDAHNLYIEKLAELGPVGLLLVLVALAPPFFAFSAVRRHPVGAAAAGGYAAFVLHAAIDWDWELPVVTLVGLLCGTGILVANRRMDAPALLPPLARAGALVAVAALAVFALIGHVGNRALAASADATKAGEFARAATDARRAIRWAPWSGDAWRSLGDAQLALGKRRDARESFGAAIQKDRRNWRNWYHLALASSGAARRAAATEAARLNPRSPEVAVLLRR